MGATVFLEAVVYALALPNGETGYVWREHTYEKKEGRGRSNWCTMAIGGRREMTNRVFGLASSIPGGMLQTPCNISVVGFIKKHIKLIDDPQWIDEEVTLNFKNSERGFYDPITNENRAECLAIFGKHGRRDFLDAISKPVTDGGQNISVNLRESFGLVQELACTRMPDKYGGKKPVSFSWQLIPQLDHYATASRPVLQDLQGPALPPPKIDIYGHQFAVMNTSLVIASVGDKLLVGESWVNECSLIDLAKDVEHQYPGYYKTLFDAYKKAEVKPIPANTRFSFDVTKLDANDYRRERVKDSAMLILGENLDQFSITMDQLMKVDLKANDNAMYWALTMIHSNNAICEITLPDMASTTADQLSMF